jgi:hypothetical protein
MKKNLLFTLIAGVLLTGLLSFTLINKPHHKIAPKKAKCFSCSVAIQTLTHSGSSFTWTVPAGSVVDHYNYGGYYQAGGTFSGSTTSTSVTIAAKPGGGRFSVTPICADGTAGVGTNILF